MTHEEKLIAAFCEGLHIERDVVRDSLAFNAIPQWDSIGHMALVAVLEREFDVMLETDDILDMSSFAKAKSILARHGVAF
jgi:acyl carrier protein